MHEESILHNMCHKELSQADIKAISTFRGFSSKEASSRNLFEGRFLSDTGLDKAFEGLEQAEIIMLHLLFLGTPVDVTFFDRLYGTEEKMWFGTFTQRYKEVFKQVKTRLIRRGLLLFAEDETKGYLKSKLERLVFCLPDTFVPHLPYLVKDCTILPGKGEDKQAILRARLVKDIAGDHSQDQGKERLFTIENGELRIQDRVFSVSSLERWMLKNWETACQASAKKQKFNPYTLSHLQAADYAFSELKPDEWISADQLRPIFQLFCSKPQDLDPEQICRAGWESGCLARTVSNGRFCFRPAPLKTDPGQQPEPDDFLEPAGSNGVKVDLGMIPFDELEWLGRISVFQVEHSRPVVHPDMVKLGRVFKKISRDRLFVWLKHNSPSFERAIGTVHKRWGKLIVHQGVLIARVQDVSLRVAIEKAFAESGQVVFLTEEYLAFPREYLVQISQVVSRSGHVVKTVQAQV